MRTGKGFTTFVPNNDLDAVGSDPGRIGEIRVPKLIRPILFDAVTPLLYAWEFVESPGALASAQRMGAIAQQLYQLGRGIDMAWAWGEILAPEQVEARLLAHPGSLHRPSHGSEGKTLAVPLKGSLESLIHRYDRMRGRFRTLYIPKPTKKDPHRKIDAGQVFVQPPRAQFRQVAYDSPQLRLLFDLGDSVSGGSTALSS
jgi:CRISPR-associated protein Csb2